MEDRLNKQFSSFEAAQQAFFKKNFAAPFAENYLDAAINMDSNSKIESKRLNDKSYVPKKILQLKPYPF